MEDGTGSMEVRQWIDQTETASDAQKRRELVPDMYVRVNGRLNNFGNKISCVAFQIRPITDFNEITYHFLETIHVHLSLTKPAAVRHMAENILLDRVLTLFLFLFFYRAPRVRVVARACISIKETKAPAFTLRS